MAHSREGERERDNEYERLAPSSMRDFSSPILQGEPGWGGGGGGGKGVQIAGRGSKQRAGGRITRALLNSWPDKTFHRLPY